MHQMRDALDKFYGDQGKYPDELDDLVAYLQWMGEPAQAQRFRLGVIVLIFALGFKKGITDFIQQAYRLVTKKGAQP